MQETQVVLGQQDGRASEGSYSTPYVPEFRDALVLLYSPIMVKGENPLILLPCGVNSASVLPHCGIFVYTQYTQHS